MNKIHQFYCNHCQTNITKKTLIICVCCTEVTLCEECFSKGVEFEDHKKTHGYKVVVCDQESIFQEDWSAEEEIRLFKAIDKKGFQNWEDISCLVGSKSESECKSHYEKVFLNSPNYENFDPKLLPPHKSTNTNNNKKNKLKQKRRNRKRMQKKRFKNQCVIFSSSEDELHSDSQEDRKFKIYTNKKKTAISEMIGYMPKRSEFEIEYNNDCEEILNQMGVIDNRISWDLKNEVLKYYNQKLEEREKNKQFVISMGLIYPLRSKQRRNRKPLARILTNTNTKTNTNKNHPVSNKRRTRTKGNKKTKTKILKKKRQFQKRMRVFAKCFDQRSDYERSCDSLYQESKLKTEIKLLLELQNHLNTTPKNELSMKSKKRNSSRKLVEMNLPQLINSNSKSKSSSNNKHQTQDKMELVETGHSPMNEIVPQILYQEDQILFEKI
ncbi:transcriptional adapter 2-alpha [Anaeramoeba flamelloides]|uniref:Transcriptional adapter 2-alpha n=1 Tax=Anaeramoeba flamelloides TaxID=1746091 RepID=A0AAV7Y861_9EUKA|nr:transcriptional adapter 2-alpha [Anaeramoeba flamelloides]